jgi:hypothetical protein
MLSVDKPSILLSDLAVAEFKRLTETFSDFAAREGLKVSPYKNSEPSFFGALPAEQQHGVLAHFANYVGVCKETLAGGEPLSQDRLFLWRMFHNMGVHPSSDLMSSILNGDVVEIYNADYVQVFRNLAFFSYCSFTLDELLCRPFWELFRRDPSVQNRLMAVGVAMFQHKITGTQLLDIGPHTVDEIDSPACYHSVIENKIASPLFDAGGKIIAVVTTIRSLSCVMTRGPITSNQTFGKGLDKRD